MPILNTVADGQLAASAAAILTVTEAQPSPNTNGKKYSLTLLNTSSSLTETVVITVQRQGGTARRVARFVLAPNEQGIIANLPLAPGDILLGTTSDATTVDYIVYGDCEGGMEVYSLDANGIRKSVAATSARVPVFTVAAGGTAIGNAAAVTEGFTYVTGGNNSAAVELPAGIVGMRVELVNAVYTATLQVFPQVNNAIDNLANNAVYNMGAGAHRVFTYAVAGQWYSDPQTII